VRSTAIALAVIGAAIGCAIGGAIGCATAPPPPEPPRLSVTVDDVGAPGLDCAARFEPVRGPRPVGSRVVARVMVAADRPAPLADLEQAALVPALRRCAAGLSVLRAEAADGTNLYLALLAEAWDVEGPDPTPAPSP
jgi:hypothetical protein